MVQLVDVTLVRLAKTVRGIDKKGSLQCSQRLEMTEAAPWRLGEHIPAKAV